MKFEKETKMKTVFILTKGERICIIVSQNENHFQIDEVCFLKIQYKTKNKQLLLEYLRDTAGRHVTVQDICDHFKAQGQSIGTTTVYRQLERMVEEGSVHKYNVEGSSAAYFEYVDHSHCGEQACFHCKNKT